MKKVIDSSEETTNVTISYFVSPFFNHFSFSLNRKKMRGNENHKSHIHASAADLLHIRVIGGNPDIPETKREK